MPEECQSIPMPAPKDWNQKGWARRRNKFVAAISVDDRFGHDRPEPRHPIGQPLRHGAAVQREVRAPGSAAHCDVPLGVDVPETF